MSNFHESYLKTKVMLVYTIRIFETKTNNLHKII